MQLQQLGLSGYGYSASPSGAGAGTGTSAGATGSASSAPAGSTSGAANGLGPAAAGLTSSFAALADVRESESLNFQLADGTEVSIRMRAHATTLEASQTLSDGSSSSAAALMASGQLQIEVKGNLSSDDLNAINNVVAQVDSLSSQFFSGDAQGAFAAAASLNMDPSEIASFSLKLSYSSELYQQATANAAATGTADAGTAANTAAGASSATPAASPQQTIINFVQQAMTKLRVTSGGSQQNGSSHWKMKLLAHALPIYAQAQTQAGAAAAGNPPAAATTAAADASSQTAPAQGAATSQPATGVTVLQAAHLAAATLNRLAE